MSFSLHIIYYFWFSFFFSLSPLPSLPLHSLSSFILRHNFMLWSSLDWNSLCSPRWPSSSVSQEFELPEHATISGFPNITSYELIWHIFFSFFNFYFLESATLCHSSFLKERFRNLSVQRLMWYLVQGWAEISVFLSRDIFFKFPGVLNLLCFQSPTTFLFSFPSPLNLSLNHLYLFFTREYCWYRSVEPVAST